MKTPKFSVLDAVAGHIGFDRDDLKDYRYQQSRTPCIVFSSPRGDADYFTATKTGRKPKEANDFYMGNWRWEEIPAEGYAKTMGWHIWRRIPDEDDMQ